MHGETIKITGPCSSTSVTIPFAIGEQDNEVGEEHTEIEGTGISRKLNNLLICRTYCGHSNIRLFP
jgi:hypothetical protein